MNPDNYIIDYFSTGNAQDELFENTSSLRRTAYDLGEPRQILLADICNAVTRKRFENSTWFCLPRYTELSTELWKETLKKETFMRELWPGQHRLGQKGVFKGKSAIVQMPTSAGKTKAIEIIIRSAFLAKRTSLAVIVAPFRALCHEIRNDLVRAFQGEEINVSEISDVFLVDIDLIDLVGKHQVLVVTPEKLVYTLRRKPEMAKQIGLLIYDEGHQFDNGTRGITYELLLTTLKRVVPKEAQTVLISAVIKNAEAVGNWLIGDSAEVVSGADLIPTYRTLAFASWRDQLGRLQFVTPTNPDSQEFFVPRVIEQQKLQLKGKERKLRMFPEKNDGHAIALYLGLRIVSNGSVAIFCGTKSTAASLCEKTAEDYDRGLLLKKPVEFSDRNEIKRLRFLHEQNLGVEAITTQCADAGILAHHNNVPHGIRLAIEHAVKKGLAKFVICTSTLAQGVNLPIRYLVVTSTHQGEDQIKVRDFHNLIGRAGRSGMYTEGSILFANPDIYDGRNTSPWRWRQIKNLLEPNNSEPCGSTLASLLEPLHNDRGNPIRMEPLEFVHAYVDGKVGELIERLASQYSLKSPDRAGLEVQIEWKRNIIFAVESYLMTHWGNPVYEPPASGVAELAQETLAYHLANDERKVQLIEIFKLLVRNIETKIPDASNRRILGRTLYGVASAVAVEEWTRQHTEELRICANHEELLSKMWSLMSQNIHNNTFKKCTPSEMLQEFAVKWMEGVSFGGLLEFLESRNVKIKTARQSRNLKLEHIVDICENALAYDGMLLIGAIAEVIEIAGTENTSGLIRDFRELQKRMKYGLPSSTAINLYEVGFADRVVSLELSFMIGTELLLKSDVISALKASKQRVLMVLEKYPRYFTHIAEEALG
ncbi:MAG: DEAD/DEAH box helicase [Chloroflexi bacterium]|nr:DEAD/DEAH box helicase [Chloroflexota bacterium]